jgi:hypothetical protein
MACTASSCEASRGAASSGGGFLSRPLVGQANVVIMQHLLLVCRSWDLNKAHKMLLGTLQW